MEEYKVLITTSGVGARLGELTKYTNKCLVRVGKKPAISYIVESYPKNVEIVITLGHFGNQVKDFLNLVYPDRIFNFVEVDKFEGDGSSLGYSLLKAKNKLQCPFIFHAADTIIEDKIEKPTKNWLGGCYKENTSQYRTISLQNSKIYEKGDMNSNLVYVGLAGINDYKSFWSALEREYDTNSNDLTLSDCHAINKMNVSDWVIIKYSNWLDIGNSSDLKHSREVIFDKFELLDKVDESIFLFDNFVVKFFYNKSICLNRIKRCKELNGLTPKMIGYTENFYKYEYASGELLSEVVNDVIFKEFLNWSSKNLWIKHKKTPYFKDTCEKFYFNKTFDRLNEYYKIHGLVDESIIINGIKVPPTIEMLNEIDKKWLCSESPYQFHGDYILDNILYNDKNNFTLLDWRQDFGGDLIDGDIYYDLAKLNHNLLFNHNIVNKGLFSVDKNNESIKCDILISDNLNNCRKKLHEWIIFNGFDLKKVNTITAIIWINMSPLHDYKMGEFLFNFGKLNLYKALYL